MTFFVRIFDFCYLDLHFINVSEININQIKNIYILYLLNFKILNSIQRILIDT
jgi:hypothetical protein